MPRKPRVIYWNGIPAPYIEQRFNALACRHNLDFEAWFSARTETGRDWTIDESRWRFSFRYLPALTMRGRRIALPLPLIDHPAPDLLVSLYAGPSFIIGWQLARIRRVRTAFPAEVTFDNWVHRRPWKEAVKRYIFPRVDGIITFGRDSGRMVHRYGVPNDRIHYVVNSIDVDRFKKESHQDNLARAAIRERLGLRGVTFLYVGRLWSGKGLEFLIDAFERLQSLEGHELSLLLVGKGPQQASLETRSRKAGLRNVVFAGFFEGDELAALYRAADIFVFPTLGDPYGLVIDEAMAASLPVISTRSAGEIQDRIQEGINGFTVAPGDVNALVDRMRILAGDTALRQQMGAASARKMVGRGPEAWAQDFEGAVGRILEMPRARA